MVKACYSQRWSLALMRCVALCISLVWAAPGRAEESLDSLLNQADQALGPTRSPSEKPATTSKKSAVPPKKAAVSKKTPQAANSSATAEDAAVQAPLTPIDPTRASEILTLDLQAREREKIARAAAMIARVAWARDTLPPVYQTDKDDDTFTVDQPSTLSGATIELSTHANFARDDGNGPSPFYWGMNAGVGYLQGTAIVRREGIEDEHTAYAYEALPLDAALSFGWQPDAKWQFWLAAGYGIDIVRQIGKGETDSFTSAFSGETLAVGVSRHLVSTYDVFLQYRQRGVVNALERTPSSSRLAGRMFAAGIGVPVSR